MIAESQEQELKDRLSLIESMIAEGRKTTESWGWCFVLWGIAYYAAIGWSALGNGNLAWPVCMIGTSVLTGVISGRKRDRQPETTIARAMGSIWAAIGISLFVLLFTANLAGHSEQHIFVAIIASMLATANAASSFILKWRAQFACAVMWWAAAIASLFGTITQSSIVFLVAIFLGQIVFGSYMMLCEARERKGQQAETGASHA